MINKSCDFLDEIPNVVKKEMAKMVSIGCKFGLTWISQLFDENNLPDGIDRVFTIISMPNKTGEPGWLSYWDHEKGHFFCEDDDGRVDFFEKRIQRAE